jgi:cytochrome c-type biogenesis protein CcmH
MADHSTASGTLIVTMRAAVIVALMLALLPTSLQAIQPDEVLADPRLEARAREIGKELRCLVCQNQSIDDSDADLARDLRVLVRQRLQAGDSNDAVVSYVVSRYGDFVLLRPPFKPATWLLWLGPAIIFAFAVVLVSRFFRTRANAAASALSPLSADEEARVARLIEDQKP